MSTYLGRDYLEQDEILPVLKWVSGRYYATPFDVSALSTSNTLGVGTLRLAPFFVPNAVTISAIGSEIQSAGESGSKLRLGIYAEDRNGRPGALVVDAGTINGDSATVQEITGLSVVLLRGIHWAGGVVQVVSVTQPTVRVVTNTAIAVDLSASTPSAGTRSVGFQLTNVTSSLPAAFTGGATSGNVPRVFVKTA